MTDHQFKIRIKLQQPTPQSIEQQYPETVAQEDTEKPPLDWYKISVALLLAGSLLGLLGYALFGWNDDEPEFTEAYTITDTNADNNVSTHENIAQPPDNLITHEDKDTENIERDAHTIKYDLVEHTDHVTALESESGSDSDSDSYATPYPFPLPKPSMLPEENTTAEIPILIDAIGTTNNTTDTTQEDHPQVVRAQLSHAIKAREPIDSINHIELDQGASKPMYFFIQLNDLAGQSVNVNWYYENKIISTKTLQIGGKNWRTYASKTLNKNRLGTWRVMLTDQSGNQLAERHFTVNKAP